MQVSQYLVGVPKGADDTVRLQFDPPNLPMFRLGTTPFIGDYIDIIPAQPILQDGNDIKFNTAPSKSPLFHAIWTDNRDVRPPMFQPFSLRGMALTNRVVVSAMDMYVASDGVPVDFHLVHLGGKALGGAALVMTEMVCVSPSGRITPGCTGLWNDEQQAAWTRIVDFVHANSSAKICLQLGHAGRKGATKLMWEGMDRPLEQGGWDTISASPLPYFPDSQVPREMDRAAMYRV